MTVRFLVKNFTAKHPKPERAPGELILFDFGDDLGVSRGSASATLKDHISIPGINVDNSYDHAGIGDIYISAYIIMNKVRVSDADQMTMIFILLHLRAYSMRDRSMNIRIRSQPHQLIVE
jgi:hypothetical protein